MAHDADVCAGRLRRAVLGHRLKVAAIPRAANEDTERIAVPPDYAQHVGEFPFQDHQPLIGDRRAFDDEIVLATEPTLRLNRDLLDDLVAHGPDESFPRREPPLHPLGHPFRIDGNQALANVVP